MKTNPLSIEIEALFTYDQADRSSNLFETDVNQLIENDMARLGRAREVYEIFKKGEIEFSANDLFYLAMIFQHSSESLDYAKTIELATLSGEKGNEKGAWLSVAAEDRYLLSKGEQQKWGTQFKKENGGVWKHLPMLDDEVSGITDEMRIKKGVPERAKQLEVFLSKIKKDIH